MRDENYFEKKLELSKDTLAMAKNKVEHFDIQMENLKLRFEHDKKVYNDQTKHMQKIILDMEKRIPKFEKKLKQGYTHCDLRTGKAYKSFDAIHIAQLEAKRQWAIDNQQKIEEKHRKRQELKDIKDRGKLSEEEKEQIIAIEIQDDMQAEDEIKANQEKELEALQKKREFYEAELEKLSVEIPKEKPKEEPVLLPKDPTPHIDIVETPDNEVSKLKSISQQVNEFKDELDGTIKEMEWLLTKHPERIQEYAIEEGGKAIHAGRIVNGFRKWCISKGYKIGD